MSLACFRIACLKCPSVWRHFGVAPANYSAQNGYTRTQVVSLQFVQFVHISECGAFDANNAIDLCIINSEKYFSNAKSELIEL